MSEMAANSRRRSGPALLASMLILIILSPLGYYVVCGVIAQGDEPSEPFLERPDPKYERCVWDMDAAEMRVHHWEHLKTIREEVVRYGNREKPGLNSCKNCHVSRERFCNACHNAVNLKPDCFGCHYYP